MGYTKTALLMAAMTALFMGVGYMLGGAGGAMIALIVAAVMNLVSWWSSDKMVLRMHNARPVSGADGGLVPMVADLARQVEMPMPAVYVIETDQPNAFATGRNPDNAAVAVTTGLMQRLTRNELAGVIAHELAHIKNRDTLIMTITATFAGAISMLANFALFFGGSRERMGLVGTLAMMFLAPLAATIVQMAISRSREYEADRIGAEICGNPDWLADALIGIQRGASRIDYHTAERHPGTAHMFIINPLHAHAVDGLFRTHPATEERVARLRAMSGPVSQSRVPKVGYKGLGHGAGPWGQQ